MTPAATCGDVKFGLLLPSREAAMWRSGDPTPLVDIAVNSEAAGFDSLWLGDSLLARPRPEPLVVLSAIAARTTRATLGTAVLLPLLRHPLNLAHSIATLDRIADGRLVLGMGPGAEIPDTRAELEAVGVPGDKRVEATLDSVQRLWQIWRGREDGVELSPTPSSANGPPMWLAAHGPRTLRVAGRMFNGWLPFSPTREAYREGLEVVLGEVERSGRNTESFVRGAYLTVSINEDSRRAYIELDDYMRCYYGLPLEVMGQVQACHAGSTASAAEWLWSYVEAGASHVVMRIAAVGMAGYYDKATGLIEALRRL